jgi:NTE family protein
MKDAASPLPDHDATAPSGAAEPVGAEAVPGHLEDDLALVLTGGGARGAYQVGVLCWIARHYPDVQVPILTGVSAGAVNTAKLAARTGSFQQGVEELVGLWSELTTEQVFDAGALDLLWNGARWGMRLISAGSPSAPRVRGLLETEPLRRLLEGTLAAVEGRVTGIDYNLERGALKAAAFITTSYTTGQTVVFLQGKGIAPWQRPQRRAVQTPILVDHVMASAALPIFFPAVQIGDHWYGDGGIRLAAPLSPALHLGAHRVLAISTRYDRSPAEADRPATVGYPPPAQMLGVLLNAVFLDLIDQDMHRLERINQLLADLPPDKRDGMRPVRLLVMRPSKDMGLLAARYEPRLPWALRFMARGLGTRETRSADVLSMLMFQPRYLQRLIRLGQQDAERNAARIDAFLQDAPAGAVAAGH